MLFMTLELYQNGQMNFEGMLICTIAMMGSFGPVTALSNLSNHLNQTLACGERVLSLLEEEPAVEEIPDRDEEENLEFTGAEVQNVTFSYGDEAILSDCTLEIPRGKVTGVFGKSGSGKSTLLKLLMRFWETDQGEIQISGQDVKEISTRRLRSMQSYVTQETQMFHDSIANNIAVGKPGASREEIVKAAKKASIHDFITSLPDGYDTEVGELGDSLSGGEKQRIGIARAFLHDAPMLLLDEPTSNLDSLNEGIILKSLEEERNRRTVVLVSHRESTIRFADTTLVIILTFLHCRFSSAVSGTNMGKICFLILLLIFIIHLFRNRMKKKWIIIHRALAVLLWIAIIVHIVQEIRL